MVSGQVSEVAPAPCIRTGQETCHDADGGGLDCPGSGQDGEFRAGRCWPQPRFEVAGDLVRDRLTSLAWPRQASLSEFPLNWAEALEFVAGLNRTGAFGYEDWRLPNRRELRSLIDHQSARPALSHGHPFEDVFQGWYWTSTTAVISPAHAWYVDLGGGRMFYGGKDQSFMVWPVRGPCALARSGQLDCYDGAGHGIDCAGSGQDGQLTVGVAWPAPRFQVLDEGILDRLTGLRWHRSADLAGGPVDWLGALAAVDAINRRSAYRWGLPNINELESLVDCGRYAPALPAAHPFRDTRDTYWSSTTSAYEPDWAWALYLDKGAVGVGQKREGRFFAWAVARSGVVAGRADLSNGA
ncbi:MAG: DUF1566 domain-containing protein [Gammaproteobacteria bacterium]